MKRKIRYQAKTDLKLLRRINGISKEYVADKIGYTIRSLERMEKENAVTTERTAHQLCSLYDLVYEEQFFIVDKKSLECVRRCLVENKKVPEHIVYHNSKYYLLYVRKVGLFQDCIAGNVMWVGNYNRNMERRRLREVNANVVLQEEPAIEIINSEDEWCYWYHNLIIGTLYKVIVSEGCMEKCLRTCLDEVIVTQDNLHSYDGITDIAFLGTKKRYY